MAYQPDTTETTELIQQLVSIPSPSGYTKQVISFVEYLLQEYNVKTIRNRKGGLIATFSGENEKEQRMLTAHLNTLGAVAKK